MLSTTLGPIMSALLLSIGTGDSTIVFGMPVASPDGKRFTLTSMAEAAGYDPSMIEVWRMIGRKPEREFSFDTEQDRHDVVAIRFAAP